MEAGLPSCFSIVFQDDQKIVGTVETDNDVADVLSAFQRCYMASFIECTQHMNEKAVENKRLLWCDEVNQNYTVPCYVDTSKSKACVYGGKPRRRNTSSKQDHQYVRGKRFHMQTSRKIGCKAKVSIRTLTLFEDYKLLKTEATREAKTKQLNLLRVDTNLQKSKCIVITLPQACTHSHVLSVESAFTHKISSEVKEKIYDLVSIGFTSVPLVRKMLRQFVQKELCVDWDLKPMSHDTAFFPKASVIRNHIHAALAAGRYTNVDQDNLANLIESIKAKEPGKHHFFFRKCGYSDSHAQKSTKRAPQVFKCLPDEDDENEEDVEVDNSGVTFLFVHQTSQQKYLLKKYGKMALLDATYKTSKYALPLFLLVVRTNGNFMPVAEFIIERENQLCIQEALELLKEWNPEWKPEFFMLDYSEEEFQALEAVFPPSAKYLCSFHREQAWQRWIKKHKNGVSEEQRDSLLELLRQIASSRTTARFQDAIKALQASEVYVSNTKLQKYLQHYWLSIPERWCALHAGPGFEGLITTNNGVEALNSSLKNSCLRLSGNGTLSCLVENMVEDFVEHHWLHYVQLNYEASTANRPYDQLIPKFLHNRPKSVVMRCHKSFVLAEYCHPQQIQNMSDGQFLVQSEDNDKTYRVHLGSEEKFPSCSCPLFIKHMLPCKHMFALMRNNFASWDDLPSHYRDSPYLCLDPFVLSKEVLEACRPKLHNDDAAVCPAAETETEDPVSEAIAEDTSTVASFLFSAQRKFREALKELVDLSYLCCDIETLLSEEKGLRAVCDKLRRQVPNQSGLPVHQDSTACRELPVRKKRKRVAAKKSKTRRLAGNKTGVAHKTVQAAEHHQDTTSLTTAEICKEPAVKRRKRAAAGKPMSTSLAKNKIGVAHETVQAAEHHQDTTSLTTTDDVESDTTKQENKKSHKTTESSKPLAPGVFVCGHRLTQTSLNTLKHPNLIDDLIIDIYFKLLQRDKNAEDEKHVFILTVAATTSWQQGIYDLFLFQGVKLTAFKWIMAPINVGLHWVLLVVDMTSREVSVMDSLPGDMNQERCFKLWRAFYSFRCQQMGHEDIAWSKGHFRSGQQNDGVSCGAFVLMNADLILKEEDPFRYDQTAARLFRTNIRMKLEDMAIESTASQQNCEIPGCDKISPRKIQCWVCCRWIHWQTCADPPHKTRPKGMFVCSICTIQYGTIE